MLRRLAVLLALLGTVLLGEVRNTLANAMGACGQRVLTALYLGLDLLAKRPIGSGCRRPDTQCARRDDRRKDYHGHFALDCCRNCGCESSCHSHPHFIT
jgi:hypothetical protein